MSSPQACVGASCGDSVAAMSGGEIRRRGDCSVEINIGLNESKATYPFLVHSQQSLSHRTPPDIDNHRLARQKRRRTRYTAITAHRDDPLTDN